MGGNKSKMADEKDVELNKPGSGTKDEVALELMKFIAVTTGYGKGMTGAGYGGGVKPRSAEEQTESLLQLFERCRQAVSKPV